MSVSEPGKIITPWAESGLKSPIPPAANPATGRAGFDQGFSAINMTAKEAGGIPPFGQDFNGIFYEVTNILRYMQAGGKPTYDAALAAAIGGYPSGAVLIGDDGVSIFQNAVDGNATDPNSGGAGWTRPDLQVMELYRRSYAEAGYNVVGTFRAGFTIVNANDVGIDERTGRGFTGPVGNVAAGTDPTGAAGFIDKSGSISISSTQRVEHFNSLQDAINFAKINEIKALRVDTDIISEEVTNKGAVAFVGNGSIAGVYRKRVAKDTDPVSASFNDLNPEVHLKRFLSKSNPVVVVVGDSISTETGANVPAIDSLYYRLKSKIVSSFPDKTITFYNRAIGGESYFTAVGLPFSFPTWYTDHARSWVLYVGDLNPDLVIFNFGMNDSSNLHTNKLTEYQGYFDTVGIFPAGRPDVIYCTNLTPAIDTTYAGLGSEASQRGRDHVAGFTRTFSKAIGAGLLDFHRQCTIVKDGYDPTDTYLERVGAITPVSGAVTATDYPCTDFKWDLTLSIAVGDNMAVRLGSPSDPAIDSAGRGSYAVVYNNGGTFKVDFFTADITSSANIYGSVTTTVPVPAGSFVLSVEKRQNTAIFSVNGTIAASFDKLRVGGADVALKAGDATYTSGTITAATLWVGRYKTYKQSLTNDDMWGTSGATATQRQPFGGNGANHPSSIGCAAVFQPVLDNANFSGVRELTGNLTLMNGWREVGGKMASVAVRVGKSVSISFTVQVPVTGTPAKGVVLNVPADFRPQYGLSAYAVIQTTNATSTPVLCDLSSNGDIQIYHNVDAIAFGVINFVLL